MCMNAKVLRPTLVLLATLSSGDMLTASPHPSTRPARTSIEGPDLVSLLPLWRRLQNDAEPERGVRGKGGVRTALRPTQRPTGISRKVFASLVHAPGDGTVARTSLLGNPVSSGTNVTPAFPGAEAVWSCVVHDKIQNDMEVQRRVLDILKSPD